MLNQLKYTASLLGFGSRQLFPLNEADLTEVQQPSEGFVNDYKRTLQGMLMLTGADYDWLESIKLSASTCEPINLTVEKSCGGLFAPWFSGQIKIKDCEWNPDQCQVAIKISSLDDYTCFEDKAEDEIDLFTFAPNRKVIKFKYPGAIYESQVCNTFDLDNPYEYWCDPNVDPADFGWIVRNHVFELISPGNGENRVVWVREKVTLPCDVTLGDPWILIDDNCPTSRTYARAPLTQGSGDISYQYDSNQNLIRYEKNVKIIGAPGDGIAEIDNGMLLSDILIGIANTCNLTVKSEFFQINPDDITAINYVTGVVSKVRKLLVFQKSDIKRPASSANATKALTKREDFIDAICLLFNLQWRIEAGVWRIEHCSWFDTQDGLDLTLPKYKRFVRFKNRHSFDQALIPNKETFRSKEATLFSDFDAGVITYNSKCAATGDEGKKEYAQQVITTDLKLVLANPASDSQVVTDAGFVLIATEEIAGQLYLLNEAPVVNERMPNNTLGWSQLLRDYHRHNRPFKIGQINGFATAFHTTVPTIMQEKLSIPFCCDDTFEPSDYVKSGLGNGRVKAATFKVRSNILEIELLHQSTQQSTLNDPPTAMNDSFTIWKNVVSYLDVLANDSDPQGIGTIIEVEITFFPVHGAVEVLPDKKIKFTPSNNYTGFDYFYYRIKDSGNEWSSPAYVSLNIIDPVPVAHEDVLYAKKGQLNFYDPPGVLINDLPGAMPPIFVVSNTTPTDLGVAVTVAADGSFSYLAPDLVGEDFLFYTIRNGVNLESTAKIRIIIVDLPPAFEIALAYASNPAEACSLGGVSVNWNTYYCENASPGIGDRLYLDSFFNTPAPAGYYGDGINVYRINGSLGIIQTITPC